MRGVGSTLTIWPRVLGTCSLVWKNIKNERLRGALPCAKSFRWSKIEVAIIFKPSLIGQAMPCQVDEPTNERAHLPYHQTCKLQWSYPFSVL